MYNLVRKALKKIEKNNGQVFFSKFKAYDIKDLEYCMRYYGAKKSDVSFFIGKDMTYQVQIDLRKLIIEYKYVIYVTDNLEYKNILWQDLI